MLREKEKRSGCRQDCLSRAIKRKRKKMLMETRQTFVPECKPIQEDMLFSDFLLQWLEIAKPTIALTTYSSYSGMAKSVIIPYFKERKITLSEIKATDIQAFYMKQLKRVKANTVIHYHSVIHRALKYAVKIDLISVNPADKVERPKADKFIGSFYDSNEVQALFEAAKGTLIEIPIFLGAFYGLRRSEALGLKWDATGDFYTVGEILGHTLKGIGMSLGISTNLEAVTAQYVNVRLERKKAVLETYHKALHPQKPTPDKGSEPKKAKKKSSEIEL